MTQPADGVSARSGLSRVAGNLAHLLGGKAGAGLISLVYLVIVARSLGSRDYGILVLVHGYVTLVGGVVAFSGWHGLVRYGAEALDKRDDARLLRLVRFMALVELGFGIAAILVAAALAPLIGPRLGWSPDTVRIAIPYSLAIVAGVRATPQGILQIAGRFDLIGAHQMVSPLARLIGAAAVWLAGGGLFGFLAVWLVAAILEGAAMWAFGLRELRRIRLSGRLLGSARGVIAENEGLKRFVIATNVDITLRELAPNLAPLTIGWLLGPAAAGLFALAQRASTILQQPAALLAQASYAVLAQLAVAGDRKGLRQTVWRAAGLSLALAVPVLLVLAVFGDAILKGLGGKSFAGGTAVLMLVAAARALALPAAPAGAALTALGRPTASVCVNVATSLGTYPLLPLFLIAFGLQGAGWHALLQNAAAAVLLIWLFRRASSGTRL